LSSLLKASLPQAGEDPQEEANSLMMFGPHQKGPPENNPIQVEESKKRPLSDQDSENRCHKKSSYLTIENHNPQDKIGERVGSEQNDGKQSCNETTSNFFDKDDSSLAALPDGSLLADPKKDAIDVAPKSGLDPVLVCLANNYSRSYFITQKKSAYQQELRLLEPNSERANLLDALILLLDQAHTYQAQILKHLEAQAEKKTSQALKNSYFLHGMMEINESPNKVERLIEEIEKDYQGLIRAQNAGNKIERVIRIFNDQGAAIPESLLLARQAIQESLAHYRALIQLKLDSAKLIRLPFNKIDPTIQADIEAQAAIEASDINIIRTTTLAKKKFFFAIDELYKIFAEQNPHLFIPELDRDLCNMVEKAQQEAQRERPRQEVINLLLDAAEFTQRSRDALFNVKASYRTDRAKYLTAAADSLFIGAEEAQCKEPKKEVITNCRKASGLYQQAVIELDNLNNPYRVYRARHLARRSNSLVMIIKEDSRLSPRQEVRKKFIKSYKAYKQVLIALDNLNDRYRIDRVNYLIHVANALFVIAEETSKGKMSSDKMMSSIRIAKICNEALTALGNPDLADALLTASKQLNKFRSLQKESITPIRSQEQLGREKIVDGR
jgi:hypothetical protein